MFKVINIKNKLFSLLLVALLTVISFILVACSGTNETVSDVNQNIREVGVEKILGCGIYVSYLLDC